MLHVSLSTRMYCTVLQIFLMIILKCNIAPIGNRFHTFVIAFTFKRFWSRISDTAGPCLPVCLWFIAAKLAVSEQVIQILMTKNFFQAL